MATGRASIYIVGRVGSGKILGQTLPPPTSMLTASQLISWPLNLTAVCLLLGVQNVWLPAPCIDLRRARVLSTLCAAAAEINRMTDNDRWIDRLRSILQVKRRRSRWCKIRVTIICHDVRGDSVAATVSVRGTNTIGLLKQQCRDWLRPPSERQAMTGHTAATALRQIGLLAGRRGQRFISTASRRTFRAPSIADVEAIDGVSR